MNSEKAAALALSLKKDATRTFNLILHFVDLIRHFNKLPVLETACGHLYGSHNSRLSESNDVKNDELYTSAQCPA